MTDRQTGGGHPAGEAVREAAADREEAEGSLPRLDTELLIMSNTGLIQRVRDPPKPSGTTSVICRVIFSAIPIAQIAIGSVYLQDCPINHYIPIYLIVVGVFGLVLNVVTSCLPSTQEGEEEEPPTLLTRCCKFLYSLISLFLFCWFITGNVWIYSIYQPDYNKNTTNIDHYCNKTLYLFAFWTTTLVYIILCVFVACGCCVFFFICILG
uniref:Uncharacterized protein n=1 Tax=Salarias fasciatus TaxID=181472 RepID=A0A672GGQ5_SALFA